MRSLQRSFPCNRGLFYATGLRNVWPVCQPFQAPAAGALGLIFRFGCSFSLVNFAGNFVTRVICIFLSAAGFLLDERGMKMSKSIGNVVDPRTVMLGGKDQKKVR